MTVSYLLRTCVIVLVFFTDNKKRDSRVGNSDISETINYNPYGNGCLTNNDSNDDFVVR